MATNVNSTTQTPLSNAAQAVAVKARLSRDLDELKRAAAGAMTLQADDDGHLFDMGCHLHSALQSLENALAAIERYRVEDRRAKLVAAEQAAALMNECFA